MVAVLVVVLALAACGGGSSDDPVARGRALFRGEGTCATCHGADLQGTVMGPSLLDAEYDAAVFPDERIRTAVRDGVRTQRRGLGVMPALPHLDDEDIDHLTAFVRSAQRAEGSAP